MNSLSLPLVESPGDGDVNDSLLPRSFENMARNHGRDDPMMIQLTQFIEEEETGVAIAFFTTCRSSP
jgi:hypothetical protein